jgi:hypothetical protein
MSASPLFADNHQLPVGSTIRARHFAVFIGRPVVSKWESSRFAVYLFDRFPEVLFFEWRTERLQRPRRNAQKWTEN